MFPIDVLFLGFLAEDHKYFPNADNPQIALGGGIVYGSLAAHNYLSASNVAIFTKVGENFNFQDFPFFSPHLFYGAKILKMGKFTTQYELDYRNTPRTLKLIHQAQSFNIEEIPKEYWNAACIVLTPIAHEFTGDFFKKFPTKIHPNTLVGFDLQGTLRQFSPDKAISLECSDDLRIKLNNFCKILGERLILKMDLYEALAFSHETSLEQSLHFFQQLGCHSLITQGMEGLHYIHPNGIVTFHSAITPMENTDETGAGDTFLAILVLEINYRRKQSENFSVEVCNIEDLISFGAAAASFTVEVPGPHGFQSRSKIESRVKTYLNSIEKR